MKLLPMTAALIIIDMQNAIDAPSWGRRNNPEAETVIAGLIAGWRVTGRPVYHIRHDSNDPSSDYRPGQKGNDFKKEAKPLEGETVIAKHTNSAFIGTDLESELKRHGHTPLIVTGVITNNSVEATVRMAGNLGFETYVVSDGVFTFDKTDLNGRCHPAEDVHALSLANMHGEYATVVSSGWLHMRLT